MNLNLQQSIRPVWSRLSRALWALRGKSVMHAAVLERAAARPVAQKPPRRRPYDINELVAKITDENRHGETLTGRAVGAEIVD